MDDKFLSYSNAGSQPESSNFDGTIQNLFTANFGGLTPVFCKPVLADDHFKISLNSEVKVSTLNAPAYSNIKQNFYSFFVANQQVWKHWNSFITNGTDFQGVYGNNMNNQQLNNAWKIPSIRVNDLQFITKIAKGFAIPVITLLATNEESAIPFFSDMGFNLVQLPSGDYVYEIKFPTSSTYQDFTIGTSSYKDLTPFAVNILQIISPSFRSLLHYIPYVYFHGLSISNDVNGDLTISFREVDFGVSIDDLPFVLSVLYKRDNILTENTVDTTDFAVNNNVQYLRYRLFCDESSHDININESPFKINYVRTDCLNGSISLNGIRYARKYTQNEEFNSVSPQPLSGFKQDIKYVRLSNFWQKQLVINTNNSNGATQISINLGSNIYYYINSSSDYYEKWLELFESEDFYPESIYENNTIYCGVQGFALVDNVRSQSPLAANFSSSRFLASNPDSDSLENKNKLRSPNCDFIFPFYVHNLDIIGLTRISLVPYFSYSMAEVRNNPLQYIPRLDSTAIANNMTISAFMYYLCNSVLKTLDYIGIPYEGFTIRDFDSYALEVVSALPFMALSSIWDEYFRNRTVSSPELNYKEVNYSGVVDDFVYSYMRSKRDENGDSEYFDLSDDMPQTHSWVIPFDVLPKNGLSSLSVSDDMIQGLNEFHYFNITCQSDLFSLLTGFQLNHCVLHQVMTPFKKLSNADSDDIILYGALINRFVLPDYYNGLLHYKFQNFSKDYFSSALLDVMSGANQEEIPHTVTELRSSEARQSFWEQTAVARSVKKFFNKMFGTTPTHMELCRPLLLGQSHNKISIGEIIQTSGTLEDSTPQGTRTGIGGGHSVNGICNHGFNEQGWLIILSSFTLDSQYFQGLNRQLIPYNSYLDYPFRNFYHIGNQSINMREISFISNPKYPNVVGRYGIKPFNFDVPDSPYCVSSFANNSHIVKRDGDFIISPNRCVDTDSKFSSVFGYIPRFSEYKFNFDELHGDFRNSLMSWNTFRKFHTIPFLTHNFVNWELSGQNYDLNRLFAVTDDSDKFICSLFINVQMHRQIPYYSIPKSSVN